MSLNLKINKKLNKVANNNSEFIKRIQEAIKDIAGYDSYGDEHDFYDEDGIVRIKVDNSFSNDEAYITFCDDGMTFLVSKNNVNLDVSNANNLTFIS